MPFNETADSLMKLNRRNTIKEEFANSPINIYIYDLRFNLQ